MLDTVLTLIVLFVVASLALYALGSLLLALAYISASFCGWIFRTLVRMEEEEQANIGRMTGFRDWINNGKWY